ncbi:MAG: hypothetical protein A2V98_06410 [Planctomycetes bacterium RBG_16_64_12]|nr:MAG: hypothetical protein A2V98_06410 [Planctomycetes bacterium RBG_16_64_12]
MRPWVDSPRTASDTGGVLGIQQGANRLLQAKIPDALTPTLSRRERELHLESANQDVAELRRIQQGVESDSVKKTV